MSALSTNRLVAACASRRGLLPYITAGDGGLDRTLRLLEACERAGAVAVELGVPFSDPMADGPILQAAAQRALDDGTTLRGICDLVARFRERSDLPVALFSYANPIWRLGLDAAAARFAEVGVDGVLVPDVPWEESAPLRAAMGSAGLCTVLFCAPTTGPERLAAVARDTTGFLYAIGRMGVTGAGTAMDASVQTFLARVQAAASTPVGLGFGLRDPAQVRAALDLADLAIIGSALVEHIHVAASAGADPAAACERFLRERTPA